MPEIRPSLWSGRSKPGPAAGMHGSKSYRRKLRIMLLETWLDNRVNWRSIHVKCQYLVKIPFKHFFAAVVKGFPCCSIAAPWHGWEFISELKCYCRDRTESKKLGSGEQKTSFMTSWSGTRHKWFSVYTPSLPVKEEFLHSKLLPDASLMMWGSPGRLYIRRSHVSHLLVLAPSHSGPPSWQA